MVGFKGFLRVGACAGAIVLAMGGVAVQAADWDGGMPGVSRVQYPERAYPDRGYPDRGYPDRGNPDRGNGEPRYDGRRNEERRDDRGGGPGGSYQRSCRAVRQDGSTLTAVCGNGRGREVESSIDLNRCGRADISNNGGVLQCGGVRGR